MNQAILSFLNNIIGKNAVLDLIIKFIAVDLMYAIPVFLLACWVLGSKKTALRAFIAGVLSWQGFANLIGHLYYRPRPFTVIPLQEGLFHRPTYSFPSDHTSFLFAIAFTFYLSGEKKVSYYLFIIAAVISISRVIVGFHYPIDILAGCVLGIITAWLIWLIKDLVNKWVIDPIIFVAKKVKLA